MKHTIYVLSLFGILALGSCEEEKISVKATRLHYYTESFEISDLGFYPQLKVTYVYNSSGRVKKYTLQSYDPDTGSMEEQRFFTFFYSRDKVSRINGYQPGEDEPYVEYTYEYLSDGNVSKIMEQNHGSGITSVANFAYSDNGSVKVSYVLSNGGAFEYEFDYSTGNVLSDKTTRGAQLCSNGQYTYDQNRNPFKELGYIDFLLTNLSTNNKLTENVSYVGCAFPTLVPESFAYEYNDTGYPVSATTFYKSDGTVAKSRKDFFYGPE